MADGSGTGQGSGPHSRHESWDSRAWEIVTGIIAALLLLQLLKLIDLGLEPLQERAWEGTLHAEKIWISVATIMSILASKWTSAWEVIILLIGITRYYVQYLRSLLTIKWTSASEAIIPLTALTRHYVQYLRRIIRWSAMAALTVSVVAVLFSSHPDANTSNLAREMAQRFYEVSSGSVALYRFSDGKYLCNLPRGTRLQSLRIGASQSNFGSNYLVVEAETPNCADWHVALNPMGVIKEADIGKLRRL